MTAKRLLKWLKRLSGNPHFDSSIEIFQSAQSGYGIRALCDISVSQTIIRIPASGWKEFSADHAVNEAKRSNPQFYELLNNLAAVVLPNSTEQAENLIKSSCLATKLIIDKQEKLRHPYIEFLHQGSWPGNTSSLPHPLLMRENEFGANDCLLKGSSTYRAIAMRRKMYDYIGSSLFGVDHAMNHEFKWAVGLVLSRALSSAPLAMPLTLVPVLDLVNHSYMDQNADHRYNKMSGEFSLITTKPLRAGEEIFINYGEGRDTASFMSLYGFFDIDNKNEIIPIRLNTDVRRQESTLKILSQPDGVQEEQQKKLSLQRLISQKYNVLIKQPKHKLSENAKSASISISASSWLPLSFPLSLDKKEGDEILEKLSRRVYSDSEDEAKIRLQLCEAVVAAAHKAIGETLLISARGIVAASAAIQDTSLIDPSLTDVHADGGEEPQRQTNVVENEVLAAKIILLAVDKAIEGFLPDTSVCKDDSINNQLSSKVSPSLLLAEVRLQYLLNAANIAIPTALSLDDIDTDKSIPSIAQQQWLNMSASVAARELDALLRLRTFCKAFLIALSSSI